MSRTEPLRIANAGGFWGDDPDALRRQVEGGPIDYLVMDYLAEVAMAILQKQRRRDPLGGYARDFVDQLTEVLPAVVDRGIRVISNAGGINPLACRDALMAAADSMGLGDRLKVGVVLGDDILEELDRLTEEGERFLHMESGRPLSEVRERVLSANVYLGAEPVVRALEMGVDVVITGRTTDTASTLAPMVHEFGWSWDDWDRLSSGVVAGHLLECGAQSTGGNFTDWKRVPSFHDMGFPIAEAYPDGSFVLTKHQDTGGLVSVATVSEQLVYEISAPAYPVPDCVVRFDSVRLRQDGPDRVLVEGTRGEPAPARMKVSITVDQGHRAFGRLLISGPDAMEKAHRVAELIWRRAGSREHYEDTQTQYVGWSGGEPGSAGHDPWEVMLQIGVRDHDAEKIAEDFAPQIASQVLSTVPGITYLSDQGRPKPSSVAGFWPALVDRAHCGARVVVGEKEVEVPCTLHGQEGTAPDRFCPAAVEVPRPALSGQRVRVPLLRLCLARSGDKGNTVNVGVIARSPAIYGWMLERLTPGFVRGRFQNACRGEIDRYELPNLLAVNFVLHDALSGGGPSPCCWTRRGRPTPRTCLPPRWRWTQPCWRPSIPR